MNAGSASAAIEIRLASTLIEIRRLAPDEARRLANAIRAAMRSMAPPPAVTPSSVADEVRKLADLRDAGVLTEAEFTAQKATLLRS